MRGRLKTNPCAKGTMSSTNSINLWLSHKQQSPPVFEKASHRRQSEVNEQYSSPPTNLYSEKFCVGGHVFNRKYCSKFYNSDSKSQLRLFGNSRASFAFAPNYSFKSFSFFFLICGALPTTCSVAQVHASYTNSLNPRDQFNGPSFSDTLHKRSAVATPPLRQRMNANLDDIVLRGQGVEGMRATAFEYHAPEIFGREKPSPDVLLGEMPSFPGARFDARNSDSWAFDSKAEFIANTGNEEQTAALEAVCEKVDLEATRLLVPKNQQRLELECAWRCIPHPLKVDRGGEDVHMVCRAGGATLLGVFDGVGGWAELGVDPADYARKLVAGIEKEFRRDPSLCENDERPLMHILSKAFEDLKLENFPGSCTVCLALLNNQGHLHVLNLGDSGLYVLRDGQSVFSTNEQQHYFNCPFQLGMGSDDSPSDGDYYILEDFAEGDVIVLATDGVWDNVFEDDMSRIVQDLEGRPAAVARTLAELSHAHGRDPKYISPFAANAAAQGMRYVGGKLDDVTVLVSKVRVAPLPTPPVAAAALGKAVAAGAARLAAGLSPEGLETSPVSSMDSEEH